MKAYEEIIDFIAADATPQGIIVDRIISLKHDGKTTPENLAYACVFCNRHKGAEVGSIVWPTQQFFNPRTDW